MAKRADTSVPTPHKAIQEVAKFLREAGYSEAIIWPTGGASFALDSTLVKYGDLLIRKSKASERSK